MNSAQETYARLGLRAPDEATAGAWDETQRSYPGNTGGAPFVFAPEYVARCCADLRFSAEVVDALKLAAEECHRSEDINRLGWHWYQRLSIGARIPHFPAVWELNANWARLFFALVFVARSPRVLEFHRTRRIVHAISIDTLSDLELWAREHKRLKGQWGMHMPGWLSNHFTGRLFKLGRLQFESHNSYSDVVAYRNTATQKVVLFAGSGAFRADGQYASADRGRERAAFTAEFSDDGSRIRGHPVSPRGFVLQKPVELNSAEWTRIFGPGDPVLGIHIAATGPMDHAECGSSMFRAAPFYAAHFPDRPFKAFACGSWLLDPQFEKYLPRESNIVRFLSEFYLHPAPHAHDEQTYDRVFDNAHIDVNVAPQRSALQKAIVEHVNSGGRWRAGSALYFPDDLNWGTQVYRAMWPKGLNL